MCVLSTNIIIELEWWDLWFEPLLDLLGKRKNVFDSTLCIVCQQPFNKSSNRGRPSKKDASKFQFFIEVCQVFDEKRDNTSDYIDGVVQNHRPPTGHQPPTVDEE